MSNYLDEAGLELLWAHIQNNFVGVNDTIPASQLEIIKSSYTAYTNQLTLATDENGNPYNNGQGWKANTQVNSAGVEESQEGIYCTGFIPVTLGDVIYFDNIIMNNDYNNETYGSTVGDTYFSTYDKDKNLLLSKNVGYLDTYNNAIAIKKGTEDASGLKGNIIQINTANAVYAYESFDIDWRDENMAYFRISCQYIGTDSVITVNEKITEEIENISLDANIAVPMALSNQNRITELEKNFSSSDISSTPNYVITEAEEVINRVIDAQGNRTFTFAALADLHYGNGGYANGIKHLGQALDYISSRIKLDAVMLLGDYTDDDNDNVDFRTVNNILNNIRFVPNLRQQGNHDFNGESNPIVFRHIQAYSDDVVWGNRIRGYYYKDFNDYKLRVISINTTDVSDSGGLGLSADQINWFIESLDMTSKSDAENWQILVISHHPLDWWSTNSLVATYILNAYQNGTSWSDNTYSCDYTNKNKAKLIGNIHGHIHNLLADYLRLGDANSTTSTEVWRIATPEGCINRANQYSGIYAEATTYAKTINTADDTSFCIYCIDLDTYTINAICYGAGYDRRITYYQTGPSYTNQIPLSVESGGSSLYNGGQGWKTGYRLNSSGAEVAFDGWEVTGFIPITRYSKVYFSGIDWNSDGQNKDYLSVYDSNFAKIGSQAIISSWLTGTNKDSVLADGQCAFDDNGNLTYLDMSRLVDGNFSGAGSTPLSNMKYFRISACGITNNSIITVDQPIE